MSQLSKAVELQLFAAKIYQMLETVMDRPPAASLTLIQ